MTHPPIPAHAGSRVDHSGWWALSDEDQHPLAGPFSTIGEAADIATKISAGASWRYGPDTRAWLVERGYLA